MFKEAEISLIIKLIERCKILRKYIFSAEAIFQMSKSEDLGEQLLKKLHKTFPKKKKQLENIFYDKIDSFPCDLKPWTDELDITEIETRLLMFCELYDNSLGTFAVHNAIPGYNAIQGKYEWYYHGIPIDSSRIIQNSVPIFFIKTNSNLDPNNLFKNYDGYLSNFINMSTKTKPYFTSDVLTFLEYRLQNIPIVYTTRNKYTNDNLSFVYNNNASIHKSKIYEDILPHLSEKLATKTQMFPHYKDIKTTLYEFLKKEELVKELSLSKHMNNNKSLIALINCTFFGELYNLRKKEKEVQISVPKTIASYMQLVNNNLSLKPYEYLLTNPGTIFDFIKYRWSIIDIDTSNVLNYYRIAKNNNSLDGEPNYNFDILQGNKNKQFAQWHLTNKYSLFYDIVNNNFYTQEMLFLHAMQVSQYRVFTRRLLTRTLKEYHQCFYNKYANIYYPKST